MSTPTKDQIKALEQSRQRLVQLTHSLASLIASLNQSDPLPSWPSLQSQATILSNNLLSISEHLSENQPLLSSLVAYPGPDFPGRTQAPTLEQLLRTKLDPRVEDWVARGRRRAVPDTNSNNNNNGGDGVTADNDNNLSEHDLAELWHWAPVEANREARQRDWGGDYTLEERQGGVANVVTGLRRVLDDGEDDLESSGSSEGEGNEGQGEDEEMEVVGVRMRPGAGAVAGGGGLEFDIATGGAHGASAVGGEDGGVGVQKVVAPVVPLEGILRFMTTGAQPGQR
ncbi:mediator complex, subunit Med8 [Aspergillus taichungensis]|uniref:Mediator of RNA polymerase II transcription subunit 8 n=1 Tax=Aspergillus taichungensis TaxID=482145 RepID=A0A2J5HZZ5_9EURO|nr:mediator complex, subunit Med8 [Aspergillus taichungensis]